MGVSFQRHSVVEGVAHARAERYITVVDRVEGYELHLLHIGFAVCGEIFFLADYVDDFGDNVASRFRFVNLFLYTAFHRHGETVEYRCVDMAGLRCAPSCALHLVGLFPATDYAYIVGCNKCVLGGESHCELAASGQVVGSGV